MTSTNELVRSIGRWSLAALVLNSIIGSGIFALPGTIAARLGAMSLLAWVVAALVIGTIMACFGEVASRFTGAGGPYLYSQAAFGRFFGLQMGWMSYLVRITAAATNINVFTTYFAEFWSPAGGRAGGALVTVLVLGMLAAVNVRGVKQGSRVSNVFAIAKILPLVLFIAVGVVVATKNGGLAPAPPPTVSTAGGWVQVILLLIYAYGGFEAALIPLAEAREPRRDAPWALFIGLVVCGILFTLVQFGVLATLSDPEGSTRPLAEAMRTVWGRTGAAMMALAALVSTYGYLATQMLNVPRLTYAMAERGDLPKVFGAVHRTFRTPHVSIVLFAALSVGLAVQGSLLQNLSLSAVSRLSTYGLICLALPVLRRADRSGDRPPALLRLPAGNLIAALGVTFSVILATRMSGREAALLGVVVAIAFVHWLVVRRPARDA